MKDNYKDKFNQLEWKTDKKVFQTIIRDGNSQIKRFKELSDVLNRTAINMFEIETITYQKYLNSLDITANAMLNNFEIAISLMDNFDNNNFLRIQEYEDNLELTEYQVKMCQIYENQIANIRKRIDDNVELLITLEELTMEMLRSSSNTNISDKTKKEIKTLIEELKFYKSNS